MSEPLPAGEKVTHPDRDDTGTVVMSTAAAWTPDELTAAPPDAGMVKVRWSHAADPNQLYWEYAAELRIADTNSSRARPARGTH